MEVPSRAARAFMLVLRLPVRHSPSRSFGRSGFPLHHLDDKAPHLTTPDRMLEPFGPLLVSTKSPRLLVPCLGVNVGIPLQSRPPDSNSGSITDLLFPYLQPDDSPAAPVFVELRYRLCGCKPAELEAIIRINHSLFETWTNRPHWDIVAHRTVLRAALSLHSTTQPRAYSR